MSEMQRNFEGLTTRPASGVQGQYYYGVKCIACGKRVAVLRDTSEGELPVEIVGPGEIQVTCSHCRGSAAYPIIDLLAFRQD